MKESLDLASAKKIIGSYLRRLDPETVPLEDALYRLPVASVRARKPQPGYDQSTRDGFVVSSKSHERFEGGRSFRIIGEIPAGNTVKRRLRDGAACRIMTGALIPAGGVRVIAQEDCRELDGHVQIPDSVLQRRNFFIRRKGCEIETGRVVVSAGEPILPGHLVLLAATGHSDVLVHRRPRITFFCTGSELVASASEEEEGLKVSGNHYLLNGLVRLSGGIPEYLGTVADTGRDLAFAFDRIDKEATDMILTTGGVGPGKYDLLEEAFANAGGKVVYRSLHIRPGKATLFGLLGKSLFFGLPGPPPAVSVLFNELVRPALLFLQGAKKYRPPVVSASLLTPVVLKETGVPSFKGARVSVQNGRYCVRLTEKTEAPAAYIFFPGRRRKYRQGDTIRVHLAGLNLFPC
jgi:molybdopterin molybdotransferase